MSLEVSNEIFYTGFFPAASIEQPLNREDGEFVDSIHSDVVLIGTRFSTGHVDFYPNYGMPQPTCAPYNLNSFVDFVNCELILFFWRAWRSIIRICHNFLIRSLTAMCSHNNAVRYWAQALDPENSKLFVSYKCPNWREFKDGNCLNNEVGIMGIETTRNLRGSFFIKLQSKFIYNSRSDIVWLLRRFEHRAIDLLSLKF